MVPSQLNPSELSLPSGASAPSTAEFFPLSYAQESLWFAEQMTPGSPTYNLPEAWTLQGELNPKVLQETLDEIVGRHETLRTVFRAPYGRPEQLVLSSVRLELSQVDLSQNSNPSAELQRRLAMEARVPFDLSRAPLARAALYQTGPQQHVLFLNLHHLISDAWSQSILIRELADQYTAKILGQSHEVAELPVQYADFCLWQRDLLKSDLGQSHLTYWKNKLGTIPRCAPIFGGHLVSNGGSHRGVTHFVKLPNKLREQLRELGRRERATVFMTLLGAFKTLLHRYTLEDQIMVGVPMACRERSELEHLVGFFVHTHPVCSDLSADPTFLELVRQIRETVLEAAEHQEAPCELALQNQPAVSAPSGHPLFQFVFGWQGASTDAWTAPGLSASKIELETGTAKFDWTILVSETEDSLLLRSEFRTDSFEPETMTRLLRQFRTLLESAVADPTRRISELELEPRSETEKCLKPFKSAVCEYERNSRIHEIFESQAAATPDSIAVEFGTARISYAELNRVANQLANHLRARGVESGTRVGLCLNRSVELITGILGILKTGAPYVPLDPESPRDRIRFVLEDCGVRTVVTKSDCASCLDFLPRQDLVVLDEHRDRLAAAGQHNPSLSGSSEDAAYVMYTSGSTGVPKGALVPHRAVVRLVRKTNYLEFSADMAVLQYAPVSFDASTFEIWGALLNGGRLVVAPPGLLSLEQLGRTILERNVTTAWLTAGIFNQMVDQRPEDLRGLKYLLTGGETLSPQHVSKALTYLEKCQLINGYGPTENTTFTCCYRLPGNWPATRPVPIGRPIANTSVFVLDKNMVPVPVGVPGELYAAGDGLSLGYLNRPELTAERFVPNPFEAGSLLYRTGDLVRWTSEGNLEFLRRTDDQVKIRGHRVEPAEIEHVIAQPGWVESSAVIAHLDNSGTKQLVAYVVARPEATPNLEQLRAFLRSKLPPYAVPGQVILVKELPLTGNGKVDRRALAQLSGIESGRSNRPFRAARTPTEEHLIEIWREVLGRNEIGVDDDFFELGGHSLLATQVISRISHVFNRELELRAIFEVPTVAQLAVAVELAEPTQGRPAFTAIPSLGSAQASRLLQQLDQLSEMELDQVLRDTELQSTL